MSRPPDSSMLLTTFSCSSPEWRRMLRSPSRTTWMTCASFTSSREHMGGMALCPTRYFIWSGVPPTVKLDTAQAASFWVLNSPDPNTSISCGIKPASITAWTCSRDPAVMLERVHTASRTMFSLWCPRSVCSLGRIPLSMTTCVCSSLPVTMFPSVRRAGMTIFTSWCSKSGTRKGITPEFMTTWICAWSPSARKERAQHASTRTYK